MTEGLNTGKQKMLRPPIREVRPGAILRWWRLGWLDFRRAGWPSAMHGIIVVVMSLVIIQTALLFWPLLPGAVSGFLVIGPVLATGLYALSWRLERNDPTSRKDVFDAWRHATRCLHRFGLFLVLVATAWVVLSVLLFYFFVDAEIDSAKDFLRYVFQQDDGVFMLWTVLAGLVAAVTFAVTVVSVPLLVDRDVTTPLAMSISIRAVAENPVTMALWALSILVVTGISIVTFMVGLIVLYPVMGHASWHVYRDVVDASGLPPRHPEPESCSA